MEFFESARQFLESALLVLEPYVALVLGWIERVFNYKVIAESLPLYFDGVLVTLKLLLIALAFGLALAVPLALMRVSKRSAVNLPAWLYTYAIRGTPMLVQLYLLYYGLAQFEGVRESFAWPYLSNATFCACLAFAINTSAYSAEILAGSLKATPHGEIEAAKAMGMSRFKLYRRILLPSALRRALPQYSNEVIMMLHTTSLASIVTLVDITGAAKTVNSQYFMPFEAYVTAGLFYLCLTFILVRLFKLAEHRWLAYLAPRKA
ncbi:ABC transporter permease subunit [Pseudomonas sp. L-22-4S-12]|nr:ABC transporter permease subunit [Pseudomonas sp. L-22-4S-12]